MKRIIFLSMLLAQPVFAATTPVVKQTKLTTAQTQASIGASVNWFKNAQEENGHMIYEYQPFTDSVLLADNDVRQAGSLYAMGEVAVRDTKNKYALKDNIILGIDYFKTLAHAGKKDDVPFQCVAAVAKIPVCKIGTTSLVLIGVLDFVSAYPEEYENYKDLIDDFYNYIRASQKSTGGFGELYYPNLQKSDAKESSYGNGEGLLALVRYAKFKHWTEEFKAPVDLTFNYISSPDVPFDSALYLWATAAIKDLYQQDPQARYGDYVKKYSDWRIKPFKSKRLTVHNVCPYIEGVVSAYPVLKATLPANKIAPYREEIDFWLAKSYGLQLSAKNAKQYGIVVNPKQAYGGFLTGEQELTQRIDFTQHCMSSYMQTLVDIDKKGF